MNSLYTIEHPKIISNPLGNVYRGIRDPAILSSLQEIYFTRIKHNCIKGWKQHTIATLRLLPVSGSVKLILSRAEPYSEGFIPEHCQELIIGDETSSYKLVTVYPLVWVAFQGLVPGESTMVNFCDQVHSPQESLFIPFRI